MIDKWKAKKVEKSLLDDRIASLFCNTKRKHRPQFIPDDPVNSINSSKTYGIISPLDGLCQNADRISKLTSTSSFVNNLESKIPVPVGIFDPRLLAKLDIEANFDIRPLLHGSEILLAPNSFSPVESAFVHEKKNTPPLQQKLRKWFDLQRSWTYPNVSMSAMAMKLNESTLNGIDAQLSAHNYWQKPSPEDMSNISMIKRRKLNWQKAVCSALDELLMDNCVININHALDQERAKYPATGGMESFYVLGSSTENTSSSNDMKKIDVGNYNSDMQQTAKSIDISAYFFLNEGGDIDGLYLQNFHSISTKKEKQERNNGKKIRKKKFCCILYGVKKSFIDRLIDLGANPLEMIDQHDINTRYNKKSNRHKSSVGRSEEHSAGRTVFLTGSYALRVVVDCLIEAVFSNLRSAKFILDVPKIVSRWPFTHGQFTPLHASFIQCNHNFYEKIMDYEQPVKDKINDGRKHLSDEFNVAGTSDQEIPLKNKRSRVPQAYHRMFLTGAIYPSMLSSLSDALYALSENHCSRRNTVVESGGESLISPRKDGTSVSSNDDKYNNNNNNISNNSNENNNCDDSSNYNNNNNYNNNSNDSSNNNNGNINNNNNNGNNNNNNYDNNNNNNHTDNDNSISSSSKSGGSDINSESNACYTSDIFHSKNDQNGIVTSNSSNNSDNKNNYNDNDTILNTSTLSRLDETFMFNYSTYERSLNHIKIKKEEGNNPSGTIISAQISSQSVEPVVLKIPFIFTSKQIDPIGNLPHRTENRGIENIKYTTVGLRRESDRNKENNSNRDSSTNTDNTNIDTKINSKKDTNDDNDNDFIDEKEKVSEGNKYEYNEQNDYESSLVLGADVWVNKRRIENKLYFVINTTPLFCTEKFNYYIPYCPLSVDSQGIENVNSNNRMTDNVSFKNEENGICIEEILDKMDSYLPIQGIRWFDSENSVLDLQNSYSMISSQENVLKINNNENLEISNNSNNLIKRKYDLNSNRILNKDDDKNKDKEEKNANNPIYDIRIIQNIKPPLMYLIKIPHSIVSRNNNFIQNPELSGAILKPMNEYEIYAPETLEDRERDRERERKKDL